MVDSFSASIWLTDAVLLGLAYWVGRVHGGVILRDFYTANLQRLLDEVKLMRHKIDRLDTAYLKATEKRNDRSTDSN